MRTVLSPPPSPWGRVFKTNSMLESEIKRKGREQLEKWGWIVNHIIQCSNNGWPDTEIFRNGVMHLIEFKQPGKIPRILQQYRIRKLSEQGFKTLVVTDLKQLENLR